MTSDVQARDGISIFRGSVHIDTGSSTFLEPSFNARVASVLEARQLGLLTRPSQLRQKT